MVPGMNSCPLCVEKDNMEMVMCDVCRRWLHYKCVNVGNSIAGPEPFICPICTDRMQAVSMSNITGIPNQHSTPVLHAASQMNLSQQVAAAQANLMQNKTSFQRATETSVAATNPQADLNNAIDNLMSQSTSNVIPTANSIMHAENTNLSPVAQPHPHQSSTTDRVQSNNNASSRVLPSDPPQIFQDLRSHVLPPGMYSNQTPLAATSQPQMNQTSNFGMHPPTYQQQLYMPNAMYMNQIPYMYPMPWMNVPFSAYPFPRGPYIGAQTNGLLAGVQFDGAYGNAQDSGSHAGARPSEVYGGARTNAYSASQNHLQSNAQSYSIPPCHSTSNFGNTQNFQLPTFDGSAEEWGVFFAHFSQSKNYFNAYENLIRLQKALKGKALALVKSLLHQPSNVDTIIEQLRRMFGRPETIIKTELENLRKQVDVNGLQRNKLESIIEFSLLTQNLVAAMVNSGIQDYLINPLMVQEFVDYMGDEMKLKWAIHKSSLISVRVNDFAEWLDAIAASAQTVTSIKSVSTKSSKARKDYALQNVHQYNSSEKLNEEEDLRICKICDGKCANISLCHKFKAMDVQKRWDVVKRLRLCYCCLSKHRPQCAAAVVCGVDQCTRVHHRMLHQVKPADQHEPTASPTSSAATNEPVAYSNIHQCSEVATFRYIPVTLSAGGRSIIATAFFDEGSSITMVDHQVLRRLNVRGRRVSLHLRWSAGVVRTDDQSEIIDLEIKGMHMRAQPFIVTARSASLDISQQTLNFQQLENRYQYLKNLPIVSYEKASPDIIIGQDQYHLAMPLKVIEGLETEPYATKTRLGWCIGGQRPKFPSKQLHIPMSYHLCECEDHEESLEELVRKFYSIESLGVIKPVELSNEEARAKKMMADGLTFTTTTNDQGRYTVNLLWKYDNVELPESKKMAIGRLQCLEKKLERNPEMKIKFNEFFQEYVNCGYLKKIDNKENLKLYPHVWYLPIFAIQNPNKPGSFRVVFDAAAKVNNVCLNDVLLKGEDLNPSLIDVLIRARQNKVCISGDIRKMFHQIGLSDADQHAQRILWRDCDGQRDPEEYVLTVLSFGSTSSPYQALYVMKHNARRFESMFPRAVQSIIENHYMDDCLDSAPTIEAAKNLASQITRIHAAGGFEIRNWVSNATEVMDFMNRDASKDEKIELGEVESEKILGLFWLPKEDCYTYSTKFNKAPSEVLQGNRIPTKRELLRVLMSIYDPLGLIEKFKAYLKIIVRQTWLQKLNWDEKLPNDLNLQWEKWRKCLPSIMQIKIPRWYLQDNWQWKDCDVQLHTFVDAGDQLYSASCYLRIVFESNVRIVLVGAKSRSAPLKYTSIPKLELQAALLGARLSKTIIQALRVQIKKQVFWTDSSTVICWLNTLKKLPIFVNSRISEILELTSVNQWRWVPSKLNVADDATKWIGDGNITDQDRWFTGPDFLYLMEEFWPCQLDKLNLPEIEVHLLNVHLLFEHDAIECPIDFTRFSSFTKLQTTMAFVLRFVDGHNRMKGPITTKELREATNVIIKYVQMESFNVKELTSGKLGKKNPFRKLCPFVDENGVMRVNGRIENAPTATYDNKFPIMLPRRHHVTNLIVRLEHHMQLHLFSENVVNEIRQRFYIPSLRRVVKEVARNCNHCRIRDAKPSQPKMAPLPPGRLAEYQPPFTHTGVDFFRRVTLKRPFSIG